jgi:hypothetical protein
MPTEAAVHQMCGRVDKHLGHYWQGPKQWDTEVGRWVRPTYWCKGHVLIEGGHR